MPGLKDLRCGPIPESRSVGWVREEPAKLKLPGGAGREGRNGLILPLPDENQHWPGRLSNRTWNQ